MCIESVVIFWIVSIVIILCEQLKDNKDWAPGRNEEERKS